MNEPVKFIYREFYDFPRLLIVPFEGFVFLFDGSFDDQLDDYPDHYVVSLLPQLNPDEMNGSWADLPQKAIRRLGVVPTDAVIFDPTRRNAIEVEVLHGLLAKEPSSQL